MKKAARISPASTEKARKEAIAEIQARLNAPPDSADAGDVAPTGGPSPEGEVVAKAGSPAPRKPTSGAKGKSGSARIFPNGGGVPGKQCTVAMWSTRGCVISAQHCANTVGAVVQFNVPPSTSAGNYVHPRPTDQYIVTARLDSGNPFEDWAVMTLGRTRGLSAYQRQRALFPDPSTPVILRLATEAPAVDNRLVIPGYGSGLGPGAGAQKYTREDDPVEPATVTQLFGPWHFRHTGWVETGNSGGGIAIRRHPTTNPDGVLVLTAVVSYICQPGLVEGCFSQPWPVQVPPAFVNARTTLCGDCLTDCDGNTYLNANDRLIFLEWMAFRNPMADLTGDGLVNALDLALFDNPPSAPCGWIE